MATTELKPGGYQRFTQIGDNSGQAWTSSPSPAWTSPGIDALALSARSGQVPSEGHQAPAPAEAAVKRSPCWTASPPPAKGGCPIRQDIPEYIELCRKGKYTEALALITEKNALPFTTGTICAHRCQTKCTRNYYDDPVQIRATKLMAAEQGYDGLMASLKKPEPVDRRPESRHHRRRPHRHGRSLLSGPGRYPRHHF